MRTVDCNLIERELAKNILHALTVPDRDVTTALENLSSNPAETFAARLIAKNNRIAEANAKFCCQDTGQAVFFVELGDEAFCPGLKNAIVSATRTAYTYARKSVADPLTRLNSGDNTPPIIETFLTAGDRIKISFLAKGAGSENMSKLYMLTPADGEDGIVNCVLDAVKTGGKNACPPLVVGVGIGGVTETACALSKKALLRPIGELSAREDAARLEKVLLKKINELGIGVAAFGGMLTALGVNIETAPTHIGMLPVAVNLQCHSVRHFTSEF